jgi:hypothetical protein
LTVFSKVKNLTINQVGLVLIAFVANEERSLDETKNVVRKKLGLCQDTAVELAQLRDGKRIDLEDGVFIPQPFRKKPNSLQTKTLKPSRLLQKRRCTQPWP